MGTRGSISKPSTPKLAAQENVSMMILQISLGAVSKYALYQCRHALIALHHAPQVGSLSTAALKHVSSIERSPGTPYRRTLAPAERTALQQQLAKKLQQLSARIQEDEVTKSTVTATSQTTAASSSATAVPPPLASNGRPASVDGVRPGTASIPLHDMVMQRPSSRGMLGSSSWSGPLSALAEQQQQQRPLSRMGTPLASGSRANLLRQSTPAGMGGCRPQTPLELQRTGTSPAMRRQNMLTQFVPSRGLLYSVFQV